MTMPDLPLPPPGDEAAAWRWRYARDRPMLEEWAAVWAKVPLDVQAEISALHEKHVYECCGYSEGQTCCVNFLDGGADAGYRDIIRKAGEGRP
jgi:hypothetical protein